MTWTRETCSGSAGRWPVVSGGSPETPTGGGSDDSIRRAAESDTRVEARLHELRHGEEEKFLAQIAALKTARGERGKTFREPKHYFANQSERVNYEEIAERGWPLGSGAVESACRGEQNRLKRRGQFWTKNGLGNLAALRGARETDYRDELWFAESSWF